MCAYVFDIIGPEVYGKRIIAPAPSVSDCVVGISLKPQEQHAVLIGAVWLAVDQKLKIRLFESLAARIGQR